MANQWFSTSSMATLVPDIQKVVRKYVLTALERTADDIYVMISNKTEDWYNAYQPVKYERTEQFYDSLTISDMKISMDNFEISIFFDPAKLVTNTALGQHVEPEKVPYYIEYGWANNGRGGEGAFIIESTIQELKSGLLVKIFEKHLRSLGLQATVYLIT